MDAIVLIQKVRAEHGWLSNMSRHPVVHAGIEYGSAEALFQALRFEDAEIQAEIRLQSEPMAAKHTAHAFDEWMSTVPCSGADVEHMRQVLRLKIAQHPELQAKLLETGEAQIIEDCTHRQHGSGLFWGAAQQADGTWHGENTLGKLWMEIRAELAIVVK